MQEKTLPKPKIRTSNIHSGEFGAISYDIFGSPYQKSGSFLADDSLDFGYLGKPYNADTELYDYGFRDYSPTIARFTSVDPIRDGRNWYCYVVNDPVNYVDLWGLISKEEHYNRNDYNINLPKTEAEAITNPNIWTKLTEDKDIYHEMWTDYSVNPQNNNKYVAEDGREVVFDENGDIVLDPVNRGTYNFEDPLSNPIGHFFEDVLPYYLWGNSEDDPTTFWERLTASYKGEIPKTEKQCSND